MDNYPHFIGIINIDFFLLKKQKLSFISELGKREISVLAYRLNIAYNHQIYRLFVSC